jgi:hypothetical protein
MQLRFTALSRRFWRAAVLATTLLTTTCRSRGTVEASHTPPRAPDSTPAATLAVPVPGHVPDRIGRIDDGEWAPVAHTAPPVLRHATDLGPVDDNLSLTALVLALKPSAAQQADLDALLAAQQNPASPEYRRWLTPDEYGARFGLSSNDLQQVTAWLQSKGFSVVRVSNSRTRVFFAGTADKVQRSFHTTLHQYRLDGELHFSNATDVSVPRALDGIAFYMGGLNDFRPRAHPKTRRAPKPGVTSEPGYTWGSSKYSIAPSDFATIYDLNNLYNWSAQSVNGAGASLAIVGQTLVYTTDVTHFRTVAGLPAISLNMDLVPNSGTAVYGAADDMEEAYLDIEWSSAVARNATINFVYTGNASGYNTWNALEYAADNPTLVGNPTVISSSYGLCETDAGSSFSDYINTFTTQANTEGITVVACAGDSGAAGCDAHGESSTTSASGGLSLWIPSSLPTVTALGGTELNDGSGGPWWSNANSTTYESALSYIPEIGWNDTALGGGLASGGGGASQFFTKPSWQTGTGVPSDGKRDVPDVSLTASWDHDAYVICLTDTSQSPSVEYCAPGYGWSDTSYYFWLEGGTSAAAPTFAGMVALLNQSMGGTGLGNINSTLYGLAASQPSAFHDVTSGNNIVPCVSGSTDCGCSAGTPGCSASSPNQYGYTAGTGYDQVTGLGSVDAYNLWTYWPTPTTVTVTPAHSTIATGNSLSLTAAITTTRIGPALSGTVTFYDSNTSLGSQTLTSSTSAAGIVSGSASLTVPSLSAGSHTLKAVFGGNSTYVTATSATVTEQVNAALSLSPLTPTVGAGGAIDFSANGGVSPFTWSLSSNNSGATLSTSGVYVAGTNTGVTDTVVVTDSLNNQASTTVTVAAPLTVSAPSSDVVEGHAITFTASGSSHTPYTWSIGSSPSHGSISSSGVYTAGSSPGTDTVVATDTVGDTGSATITVVPALAVSPSSPISVGPQQSTTLTVNGTGLPGISWTLQTNASGASLSAASGNSTIYKAGTTPNTTDVLVVTDAASEQVTLTINVGPAISIAPSKPYVYESGTVQLSATGGATSATYTWTLTSTHPVGSLTGSTYTAGTTAGVDTIKATDAAGNTATTTVTVAVPLAVSPAATQTVAPRQTVSFSTGATGAGTVSWAVSTNGSGASLSASTGATSKYLAGATGGATDVVTATDQLGTVRSVTIDVGPGISITPWASRLGAGQSQLLSAQGGYSPGGYTWSITNTNPSGTLAGGFYVAGSGAGTDTVQASDALGNTASQPVEDFATLVLSPSSPTVLQGGTVDFTASGGDSANGYTWTVVDDVSGGSFLSGGEYQAGQTVGVDTVQVEDDLGETARTTVTVAGPLAVTPSPATCVPLQAITLSTNGSGIPPFSWALSTNQSGGSITAASNDTATYTAGATGNCQDVVTVTDADSEAVSVSVGVGGGVTLTPLAPSVLPGGQLTFSASGGDTAGGYTWSVVSAERLGSFTNDVYTAGPLPGTDTIQVADSLGNVAVTTVTIVPPLELTPLSPVDIAPDDSLQFSTNGTGAAPVTWALTVNGSGATLSGTTGSSITFTATGTTDAVDVLTATDALGETASVTIVVGSEVAIQPIGVVVVTGGTQTFSAAGGSGGYVFTVVGDSPNGSFNGAVYTAGSAAGTDTVEVTDSSGNTSTTSVTIVPPLAVTPASPLTLAPQQAVDLTTSGTGVPPITWAFVSDGSGGTLSPTSGVSTTYTTGATGGTADQLQATDAIGEVVTLNVTVSTGVGVTPQFPAVVTGRSLSFTAGGGSGTGYVWSFVSNQSGGGFSSNVYTAGATSGTDTIKVTDSLGNTGTTSVTVVAPLSVSPTSPVAVVPLQKVTFTASHGLAPLQWSFVSNNSAGTLSAAASQAAYQAGVSGSVQDTIVITDALDETVTLSINVGAAITLSPASATVTTGNTVHFSATGGSGAGYAWSIPTNASGASFTGSLYKAGPTGGVDTVKVVDSLGNAQTALVTVVSTLASTPASPISIGPRESQTITASGGTPPYSWTQDINNSGMTFSSSGAVAHYVAGSVGSVTDSVVLFDSAGNVVTIKIDVGPDVTLSPASPSIAIDTSVTFSASGGTGQGFTYALVSAAEHYGTLSGSTYTAGSALGTDTIQATDSLGNVGTTTITIVTPLSVTPTSPVTVAPRQQVAFSTGGTGARPVDWTLTTDGSGGTVGPSSGATTTYIAGATGSSVDVLQAEDQAHQTVAITINVEPGVSITPPEPDVVTGGTVSFSAAGGSDTNFVWSVITNQSGGSFSGSTYTAGGTAGVDTVQVHDNLGNTATTTVTVVLPLSVSPHSPVTVTPLQVVDFTALNGLAPYTWALVTNASTSATLSASGADATYQAGSVGSEQDKISVTDALQETVTILLNVSASITITPSNPVAITSSTVSFSARGGSGAGYVWSVPVDGSGGSISGHVYTAGAAAGTDTVEVTDSLGNVGTTQVTVVLPIAVTPASPVTVAPRQAVTFAPSQGSSPYSWTFTTNASGGTLTTANGQAHYTAGATASSQDVLTLTDSLNESLAVVVNVGPGLSISPLTPEAPEGGTITFSASGGTDSGLTWTVTNDESGGFFAGNIYSAGANAGTDTVQVVDSVGNSASTTVTVYPALTISPASPVSVVPLQRLVLQTNGTGLAPYSWQVLTNPSGGLLGASTGSVVQYLVGSSGNTVDTVLVTDAAGDTVTVTLDVGAGISINPLAPSALTGTQVSFSASGGSGSDYSWSLLSNPSDGTLQGSTLHVGSIAGVDTVQVRDSYGNTATTTVNVVVRLEATPASPLAVAPKQAVTFNAADGAPPYQWTLATNGSGATFTAGATQGFYQAGSTGSAQDKIILTDALNETVTIVINVSQDLVISPLGQTVVAGSQIDFSATGGTGTGYGWTLPVNASGASFSGAVYTAGSLAGTDTVQVTDSLGNVSTTTVTVVEALAVSPTPPLQVAPNEPVSFTASLGLAPYSWTVLTNGSHGTFSSSGASGSYRAGTVGNTLDQLVVTDSLGETLSISISVGAALSLTPLSSSVVEGQSVTFAASGGSGSGYLWSVMTNASGASFVGDVYTAGQSAGTDTVEVSDTFGSTALATVTVLVPLTVTPASPLNIAPQQPETFTASNGLAPYTWTLQTNGSGAAFVPVPPVAYYAAGRFADTQDVLVVTDALNESVAVTVNVGAGVTVTPASVTLTTGGTQTYAATGGSGSGYRWSLKTNNTGGSMSGDVYTAGPIPGVDTIEAVDAYNNAGTATATVVFPLSVVPSSPVSVAPRQTLAFSAGSTGAPPLNWQLTTNGSGATLTGAGFTAAYQAGAIPSSEDVVTVTDAIGESVVIAVDIGPGLTLTPLAPTVASGGTVTFSATGGDTTDGYTWTTLDSESGGSFAGSVYRAGLLAGTDTVQVEDALGNTATTTVTVVTPLTVQPASPVAVAPRQSVTLDTIGTGAAPFSWRFQTHAAGGSLSATSGSSVVYTAGTTPSAVDVVVVTDVIGESATVSLDVGASITISPSAPTVAAGGSQVFTASGGDQGGGYTWSIATAGQAFGSLSGSTYTAGALPGVDTIQVKDTVGNTATATITVVSPLAVTPASPVNAAPHQAIVFSTGGTGASPVSWSLPTNGSGGSLSATSGTSVTYTAGIGQSTTDILTATDSIGEIVAITIEVAAGLTLSPLRDTIVTGTSVTFTATGGDSAGGYTFTVLGASPNGTFDGDVFTAGSTAGTDTVQVRDAAGNTASTTITTVLPLGVTPGSPLTAAPLQQFLIDTNGTGVPPFSWTLQADGSNGTLDANGASATYTAGSTGDTVDIVTVSDAANESVSVTIDVTTGISISPVNPHVVVHGSLSFSAAGGSGLGYTWTVPTNPSGASFTGSTFLAGSTPGMDVVQVEDTLGNTAQTNAFVVAALSVSPASPVSVAPMQPVTFTASNGLAPFQWTVVSNGSGGVFSATGAQGNYVAGPAGNATDSLSVTDALGEVVDITVTTGAAVSVSPLNPSTDPGGTIQFSASGGSGAGYRWTLSANVSGASLTGSTYTAGSNSGVDTIEVADSDGNLATTTITVVPTLAVSPTSPLTEPPLENVILSAVGGLAPYAWSIQSNGSGATLTPSGAQASYTAGPSGGTQDVLKLVDSLNETVTIDVSVTAGVTISPLNETVAAGSNLTFQALGGSGAGFVFTIPTNVSGGTFSGNIYTAGLNAGTDTVEVTDSLGNTAATTVLVVPVLAVTPASPLAVAPGQSVTFTTNGTGSGPLTWSLKTNGSGGSLSPLTGATTGYTAGRTSNSTDVVSVTDSIGETVLVTINVGAGVTVTPATSALATGTSESFSAAGGSGSYTWTVVTASGALGTFVGSEYTAGSRSGTDTVEAQDTLGNTATATVTIVPALKVSPTSPISVIPRQQVTFNTNGTGLAPFTWNLPTNGSGATLSTTTQPSTLYTAGTTAQTQDAVSVTDALGESVSLTVNVGAGVSLSPLSPTILTGGTVTFSASGGEAPYTFTVPGESPNGSFSGDVYTAGLNNGTDTIAVTDSVGNTATTTVTIVLPLAVTPAGPLTVAPLQPVSFMTGGTGLGPFHWSFTQNNSDAQLSATSGPSVTYTPGAAGSTIDVVTVTDAFGEAVSTTVTVKAGISVSPRQSIKQPGQTIVFTATGGEGAPYTWTISNNVSGGHFTGSTYTAGPTPGIDTVEATDALGNSALATVTVIAPLTVTPPSPLSVAPLAHVSLTASGGLAPYTWVLEPSASSATLSASGSQATYRAGAGGNTQNTIVVTDGLDDTVTITISVGPGITITPSTTTLIEGGTVTLQATGGSGTGFVWSIPTNASGGSFSGDVYTAGTHAGADTVEVTDNLGNTATATVAVLAPLSVTPASPVSVAPRQTIELRASGGQGPYSWTPTRILSGGTLTAGSGSSSTYTAGINENSQDLVTVTDSLNESVTVTIDVGPGISITPVNPTLPPTGPETFTATGGDAAGGYTWTLASSPSGGTLFGNGSSGFYTAGTLPGNDVVQATDALGNSATTTVTVVSALGVSPSSRVTAAPNQSVVLTARNGLAPYQWALTSSPSGGSLTAQGTTATYQAGSTPLTQDVVTLTDSLGEEVTITISVGPGVSITPATVTLAAGQEQTFVPSGGTGAGYVWAFVTDNSGGTLTGSSYTAGPIPSTDTISVIDSAGNTATATITVLAALTVTPTSPVSVAPLGSLTFMASSGMPPYAWTLEMNGSQGAVTPSGSTCLYKAGATGSTTDTIILTDQLNESVAIVINIGPVISISPPLAMVMVGGTVSFTATGGAGSYEWSFTATGDNSGGTVSSAGVYTAGNAGNVTDTIQAFDSLGNSATASILVAPLPVADGGTDAGESDAGSADAGITDAGATSDAGEEADAGVSADAGELADAGAGSDAGEVEDAGETVDAGPEPVDAGTTDGGSGKGQAGCACGVGSGPDAATTLGLLLAAVASFRRRVGRRRNLRGL